jgi:hypothetical protein
MYLRLGTWAQRWSPGDATEIHEDSLSLNARGSQGRRKVYYILIFFFSFLAGSRVTTPLYMVEGIFKVQNLLGWIRVPNTGDNSANKLLAHVFRIFTRFQNTRKFNVEVACFMGIQPADSAGWRLKQCSILSAAARRWLVSAITSLGGGLTNQKI